MGEKASLDEAIRRCVAWREKGHRIVLTNGHFDVLHVGHVDMLQRASELGDVLVAGINSDASTRSLKGPLRPIVPQEQRATMLAALESVDLVVIFDAPTAAELVEELRPDVYAKGGDWSPSDDKDGPPEMQSVMKCGGEVVFLPYRSGHSTSSLIDTIIERYLTSQGPPIEAP